jgi:hypothetical protein
VTQNDFANDQKETEMKLIHKLGLITVLAGVMALIMVMGMGGVSSATTPTDPAGCYCTQPALSLTKENVYWGSMADYSNGTLSVDYDISNNSDNYANAKNMQIVGTTNTAGVLSVDHGRNINMVSAGECELVTVKYQVPPAVSVFSSTVYATTRDQCGNSYSYPGPMP